MQLTRTYGPFTANFVSGLPPPPTAPQKHEEKSSAGVAAGRPGCLPLLSAPQIQCQCVYVSFVWSPTPRRLLLSQLRADEQVSQQLILVCSKTPPPFSAPSTYKHTHTYTQGGRAARCGWWSKGVKVVALSGEWRKEREEKLEEQQRQQVCSVPALYYFGMWRHTRGTWAKRWKHTPTGKNLVQGVIKALLTPHPRPKDSLQQQLRKLL